MLTYSCDMRVSKPFPYIAMVPEGWQRTHIRMIVNHLRGKVDGDRVPRLGTKHKLQLHFKSKNEVTKMKIKKKTINVIKVVFFCTKTQISEDLVICLFLLYQRHIVKLVNGKEKCLTDNVILYVKYHLCIEF